VLVTDLPEVDCPAAAARIRGTGALGLVRDYSTAAATNWTTDFEIVLDGGFTAA